MLGNVGREHPPLSTPATDASAHGGGDRSSAGMGTGGPAGARAAAADNGLPSAHSAAAGGGDGEESDSPFSDTSDGEPLPSKIGENVILPEVRVGAVERWSKVVYERSARHARRGTTAQLHLANISTYLVHKSKWVKRRGFTSKSLSRLVDAAIKFVKKNHEVATQVTGLAARAPGNKVDVRINAQSGYWRCSIADIKSIIVIVERTLPLVGGVQRGSGAFEGAPPVDAPPDFVDLVASGPVEVGDGSDDGGLGGGGGGGGGDGDSGTGGYRGDAVMGGAHSGDEEGPPAHQAPTQPVVPDARVTGSGGGAAVTTPGPLAGGASGRSVRAAQAENALFPGAAQLFSAMTQSFNDSARRHAEDMKSRRIASLSELLQKHPDRPGVAEQLNKLLE
ncbi:hypothetical protein BU14_0075s0025 [Porphyra umbilicalis]|uniref:Uncharacterized protein n=1 Tax=Porphyra umbilicalis TaxID=2786 RepID=A0A1X6PFK5_PORUM|nr:hypothetical protein BU14_0075s0025 [Porphyra umbilicalis]|eukprot:OSX79535.1 hypothetical protein BU14_0075s0025 [Porphyra umbilicalis]